MFAVRGKREKIEIDSLFSRKWCYKKLNVDLVSKPEWIVQITRINNDVSVKMREVMLLFGSLRPIQPLIDKKLKKIHLSASHRGVQS